jgi:hypothetical protein
MDASFCRKRERPRPQRAIGEVSVPHLVIVSRFALTADGDCPRSQQVVCYFFFADALMTFFNVGRSTSLSLLIYKQPFPTVCLPSFFIKTGS